MKVKPHRFCALVLAWCLERIKEEKREEWLYQMDLPLPGEADQGPTQEQLDREAREFLEFQAQMTGA